MISRAWPGKPLESNDIDIFVPDQKTFEQVHAALDLKGYFFYYGNERYNQYSGTHLSKNIQLIKPGKFRENIETLDALLDSFDFTIIQTGFSQETWPHARCNPQGMNDESDLLLRWNRLTDNPFRMFKRAEKYIQKGYEVPLREVLNLLSAWDRLSEDGKQIARDLSASPEAEVPGLYEIWAGTPDEAIEEIFENAE